MDGSYFPSRHFLLLTCDAKTSSSALLYVVRPREAFMTLFFFFPKMTYVSSTIKAGLSAEQDRSPVTGCFQSKTGGVRAMQKHSRPLQHRRGHLASAPGSPRPRGHRDAPRPPRPTLPGAAHRLGSPVLPQRPLVPPRAAELRGRALTWPRLRRSSGGGRCGGERARPGTAAAASGPGLQRLPPLPGSSGVGSAPRPAKGI